MPELPEVEVLCRRLDERTRGRSVAAVELASISALKTFDPPLSALSGAAFSGVERRGKFVCCSIAPHWLVLHLARSGWVRWREHFGEKRPRPGRGPLALRVRLAEGDGFEVTEMATEKRVGVWVVSRLEEVEGIATLGSDALSPDFDAERLAHLLAEEKGDVKHALSRQSVIAGIGNAYSDEALHRARLSPFRPASKLSTPEVEALHDAMRAVLEEAIAAAEALDIGELKDGKRAAMQVHGRTGLPCPRCGDTVREVAYASRSLQYCPTCQTEGRVLADRRLSRLLK